MSENEQAERLEDAEGNTLREDDVRDQMLRDMMNGWPDAEFDQWSEEEHLAEALEALEDAAEQVRAVIEARYFPTKATA